MKVVVNSLANLNCFHKKNNIYYSANLTFDLNVVTPLDVLFKLENSFDIKHNHIILIYNKEHIYDLLLPFDHDFELWLVYRLGGPEENRIGSWNDLQYKLYHKKGNH